MGLQDYPAAVDWLEQGLADDPGFGTTLQALAAAYELAGQHDKARVTMAKYLQQTPDYTLKIYLATSPFIEPNLRARVAEVMTAVGLPTG